MAAVLRPMTREDVEAVVGLKEAVWGVSPGDTAGQILRHAHLVATDPGGAWVSVDADGVVDGCAQALVREGLWGLSLLIVHPDRQSGGLGRELLAAATGYGSADRGVIVASSDARALRSYWRAGFALRPTFDAKGAVRDVPAVSPAVREGRWPADRDLVDAAGRHARGAGHGQDIGTYLAGGHRLRVHDDGGFAVHTADGRLRLLAATDERVARELLGTVLAGFPTAAVEFVDARQDWAIDVCLTAGLRLVPDGAVCVRGEVGPLRPYIPSGAYL